MYFKRLLLVSLVLAVGCDDGGGGGSPVDATVSVDAARDHDAAPDAAPPIPDRGAPDAALPPVDAALPPVDAAPPPQDAAPPPDAACTQGTEGCVCGLNGFCNIGLVCTEGRCQAPCPPGTAGCPCDAGACDDGLFCDPAGCRAPVDCDEVECLEHQLCEVDADNGPACQEACEEGFAWQADPPACAAIVPVACADLACQDAGRVCVEDGGARCGGCLPGLLEANGTCRAPIACDELACAAENRGCDAALGQDAACGGCLAGFMEVAGVCRAPGCEVLDCGAQNRACQAGEALCGACLAGFMDVDGACVAEPEGCVVLNCGAQNRRCVNGPEPVCGACLVGFVEEAGACVVLPVANCDAGARGSILADCQAERRVCVADGNGARCAGCQDGLAESPAGDCVDPVTCDDLDCGARGRTCAGAPFAACGGCIAGTRPADPDDPASACVPPLTCADIACEDGEFCLEGNGGQDAACSPAPCDDGEAFRLDRNLCVACGLLCGEEGETGRVAPFTQAFSDDCVCETESGYYADVAGAIRALPCDADHDGWVRLSARASIESADETIRDNARCQLRQITSVALQNEVGQRYVLRSCEAGFVTPNAPPCGAVPIGLYESVRNDDAVELARDRDVPAYTAGGVGRTLRPEELNSLTKACVSARGDHNHNGLADVAEYQDVDPPADLDPALRPFLSLSYFIELHRGFYEAPANGGLFGTYVIAERSRCADTFPLTYGADEGAWWQSCMRNRDAGFDDDPSVFNPVGYDFAQYACDAASGTCPTPPPVTGVGPVDEVTPHDLCTVPAPQDGVWRGMSHHSQFRCVIVTNEADLAQPRSLAPQEITASAIYNGVQGTRSWQFNACGVACPANDPSCAADCGADGCAVSSDTPGGLINPASPVLTCAPTLQSENDAAFPAGAVGFVAARYVDAEGVYVRGCINEWAPGSAEGPWKNMCPGYTENPDGVVGDANSGNFGRLLCGCGFAYGGAECDLGCPSLGIDSDGDHVLDTDVGGLHYGGDVESPLCDAGYCPNDPESEDGGRRGFWMCGAFSVTSQHGTDDLDPHALVGDGFRLRGGVMPNGFTGRSCEQDDCSAGWQVRPANLADLDP